MKRKIPKENQKDFEKQVKEAMDEIVKNHQHNHPLYQKTHIVKSIIDKENQRAAFVLFEQIDTDRCTPEGEGWLGNQFRYSVWYIQGAKKPERIYEDHSWIRATVSGLTGTRGRDPYIGLEELLDDGVIATITPEGTQSAYGSLSQTKVKITLGGKVEEPENFIEQAENLIKRIGDKLGYDFLRGTKQLKGKNIAAIGWGTENGTDYGYDTIYLVWKNKKGKLQYKEITNSKTNKAYLNVNGIKIKRKEILIDVNGKEYSISLKELDL